MQQFRVAVPPALLSRQAPDSASPRVFFVLAAASDTTRDVACGGAESGDTGLLTVAAAATDSDANISDDDDESSDDESSDESSHDTARLQGDTATDATVLTVSPAPKHVAPPARASRRSRVEKPTSQLRPSASPPLRPSIPPRSDMICAHVSSCDQVPFQRACGLGGKTRGWWRS